MRCDQTCEEGARCDRVHFVTGYRCPSSTFPASFPPTYNRHNPQGSRGIKTKDSTRCTPWLPRSTLRAQNVFLRARRLSLCRPRSSQHSHSYLNILRHMSTACRVGVAGMLRPRARARFSPARNRTRQAVRMRSQSTGHVPCVSPSLLKPSSSTLRQRRALRQPRRRRRRPVATRTAARPCPALRWLS